MTGLSRVFSLGVLLAIGVGTAVLLWVGSSQDAGNPQHERPRIYEVPPDESRPGLQGRAAPPVAAAGDVSDTEAPTGWDAEPWPDVPGIRIQVLSANGNPQRDCSVMWVVDKPPPIAPGVRGGDRSGEEWLAPPPGLDWSGLRGHAHGELTTHGARGHTPANGRVVLPLPEGSTVRGILVQPVTMPSRRAVRRDSVSSTFHVLPDGVPQYVEVRMNRHLGIRVQVVDERGRPQAGHRIYADQELRGDAHRETSRARGHGYASFGHLLPGVPVRFRIRRAPGVPSGAPHSQVTWVNANARHVVITAPETHTLELEVDDHVDGSEYMVRIGADGGQAPQHAPVVKQDGSRLRVTVGSATTPIAVWLRRHGTNDVRYLRGLRAIDGVHRFRYLLPVVRVRVLDQADRPLGDAHLAVNAWPDVRIERTSPEGMFTLRPSHAGTHWIEVRTPSEWVVERVPSGSEMTIRVRPPRDVLVRIQFEEKPPPQSFEKIELFLDVPGGSSATAVDYRIVEATESEPLSLIAHVPVQVAGTLRVWGLPPNTREANSGELVDLSGASALARLLRSWHGQTGLLADAERVDVVLRAPR